MRQEQVKLQQKPFIQGSNLLLACWQYTVVRLKMRTGQISHSKQFIQHTYYHCSYSWIVQEQPAKLSKLVPGAAKMVSNSTLVSRITDACSSAIQQELRILLLVVQINLKCKCLRGICPKYSFVKLNFPFGCLSKHNPCPCEGSPQSFLLAVSCLVRDCGHTCSHRYII